MQARLTILHSVKFVGNAAGTWLYFFCSNHRFPLSGLHGAAWAGVFHSTLSRLMLRKCFCTGDAVLKVIKSMNHNMVLAEESNGSQCICRGKGIGFQKRTGDDIDESLIEQKYVPAGPSNKAHFVQLFSEIPDEYWNLTADVVDYARNRMKLKASDKVMLPLCDHIAGAVERYRQNVKLENPMLWVVKYIYPKEFKTGRYAVRRIEEMTGIRMLDDEAAFLAYHFVIEELGNDDQTNAETMSKIVRDILHIVEQSFQIELNPEDWNYERFLTHLKFFVNRIIERKTYEDSEDQSLYEEMKARYPKVHRCVERIADYILIEHHYDVGKDERLYLIIHLERVTRKAKKRKCEG